MKSTFLHVLSDEKVVNSFISMMEEVFPGENTFLVVMRGESLKHVLPSENVIFYNQNSRELKEFLHNIEKYNHICLHSLGGQRYYKYIHHHSMSWVIWGADMYESVLRFKGYQLYSNEYDQYKIRAGKMPVILYRMLTTLRDRLYYYREMSTIKLLKYVITDNGCDYSVLKCYLKQLTPKWGGIINYYPIEALIHRSMQKEYCKGKAVWVGNNSQPNGNHKWIFNQLGAYSKNIKVYAPISYGDKRVANYIEKEGKRIFGDRFEPMKEFLPVKEYYSKFLDANAFVFGHFRQCAVGNILVALYFGGKVFLSEKNPLLPMYKEMGLHIYSIENEMTEEFAITSLSEDQRLHNRKLVCSIASYENSIVQMRNVFAQIKKVSTNN